MQKKYEKISAIAYCSKTLNKTESNYPATHGELAAIVHSLNIFRPIIYGSELLIMTDHKPLIFLFEKAQVNAKLNRWLMEIQEINPKICYIEGKNNSLADALSRVKIDSAIDWNKIKEKYFREEIPYILNGEEITLNRNTIEIETLKDKNLKIILKNIKENWLNYEETGDEELKPFYKIKDELYCEGNIIMKNLAQIVIPESLKKPILNLLHKAHFGIEKTKCRGRKLLWWPNFGKDIENYIKACEICQRNSNKPPKSNPKNKWPIASFPMERIHADLAGPIWNTNFLIVVDAYTRYIWAFQINNITSKVIISTFNDIFCLFGNPKTLITDNGTQFCSTETENFLIEQGVEHLTSPIYHPSSNGCAEKAVQTFKKGLKKLLEEKYEIKEAIKIFLKEYRSTPIPKIGDSPAHRMFKREMNTQIDKLRRRQGKIGHTVRKQTIVSPRKAPTFSNGDLVWAWVNKEWLPGTIIQLIGDRMFAVKINEEEKMIHLDHIKSRRSSSRPITQKLHQE
ncbi:unnamed protein product [Meloidogyne enterolobii]|uniref:Uncharacterized protein n=1 Tax=Meloidogyne enterolobii TaxID=390850 RepID=A0ACB0Z6J2_MELEN